MTATILLSSRILNLKTAQERELRGEFTYQVLYERESFTSKGIKKKKPAKRAYPILQLDLTIKRNRF